MKLFTQHWISDVVSESGFIIQDVGARWRVTNKWFMMYLLTLVGFKPYECVSAVYNDFNWLYEFSADEPGHATVRKLINGIKAKNSVNTLLNIIHEIPESEKSFFMLTNDEGKSSYSLAIDQGIYDLTIYEDKIRIKYHNFRRI